jgi:hypothetical protein
MPVFLHRSALLWQAGCCSLDTRTIALSLMSLFLQVTDLPPGHACLFGCVQVMTNASYAQNAQGVAASMQRYATRRQPYERAADEVELSILTAHVRASAAAAAAAGRPKATNAGAAQRQQPGRMEEL